MRECVCSLPYLVIGSEGEEMMMYKAIDNYILHLLDLILKKY